MITEHDETRTCGMEGFTVLTHAESTVLFIDNVIEGMRAGTMSPQSAAHFLRSAKETMTSVDVDTPCPFSGDVTVSYHPSRSFWICPICRFEHEQEDE